MKKIFWQTLIASIFLITACAGTPPQSQPTSAPVSNSLIATSTFLPTATQTSIPSTTPTASTPALASGASVTPLPTIPTFTPTFDASTILTVTPAPKAECPEETLNEVAQSIAKDLKSTEPYQLIDVTNDGQSEILINGETKDGVGAGSLYIYSCQSGTYTILHKISALESPSPQLAIVQDLNKNGISEIVIAIRTCGGFGSCWVISILEWDGEVFQNLADDQINEDRAPWLDKLDFDDTDNNGTIEIIVSKGLPSHPDRLSDGPWRKYTEVYSWNGKMYVQKSRTLTSPQFRFQVIQDADQETIKQNYDMALSLYQEAIFSDKLEWWSIDRHIYYRNNIWESTEPTPLPDSTEYPNLAAYADYRIMLLHLIQGHESDATTAYNTLQQKFGNDPYGHPYAEMATAFWDAYQSAHSVYDGCAAAIQYAAEHPEILTPLGSGYHGAQSHQYKPEDVCPFR